MQEIQQKDLAVIEEPTGGKVGMKPSQRTVKLKQ